jgi:hypothetical protein
MAANLKADSMTRQTAENPKGQQLIVCCIAFAAFVFLSQMVIREHDEAVRKLVAEVEVRLKMSVVEICPLGIAV